MTLAPGVAPTSTLVAAGSSRSNTYTDDFDADGIVETRTPESWTFDPALRRCTQITEIDFDADGTVDSRSVASSTVADSGSC